MTPTSEIADALRRLLVEPTGGVVGLVDDLLKACWRYDVQLDWQAGRCRIRPHYGDWEDLGDVPGKSIFRAILARIGALCNEQSPGSVSPYGGEGELPVGDVPGATMQLRFVNSLSEQRVVLGPRDRTRVSRARSPDSTVTVAHPERLPTPDSLKRGLQQALEAGNRGGAISWLEYSQLIAANARRFSDRLGDEYEQAISEARSSVRAVLEQVKREINDLAERVCADIELAIEDGLIARIEPDDLKLAVVYCFQEVANRTSTVRVVGKSIGSDVLIQVKAMGDQSASAPRVGRAEPAGAVRPERAIPLDEVRNAVEPFGCRLGADVEGGLPYRRRQECTLTCPRYLRPSKN